jgi:hypothetical protein
MFGGGVRFCRCSVTSLWLAFPGGAVDAEATGLQGNNFSYILPFSDGDLLRRQQRLGRPVQESRASASSSSSGDDVVDPVNLKEDDVW